MNSNFNREGKDKVSDFESSLDRISWEYAGEKYEIENQYEVIARLLGGTDHIAIIEAPFNPKLNRAYIIDASGDSIMNINGLVENKYGSELSNSNLFFTDVYYIGDQLFFFLTFNNTDFRIEVHLSNKSVGDLIESR